MPLTRWNEHFWSGDGKGFDVLVNRLQASHNNVRALSSHFQARMTLEEEYTKKMSKILKEDVSLNETGTLKDTISQIQNNLESTLRAHEQLMGKIKDTLIIPLETVAESEKKIRKQIELEYKKQSGDLSNEFNAMERYAKEYISRCKDAVKAEEKAAQPQKEKQSQKDYDKLQEAALKAKSERDKSEMDYVASIDKFNAYQDVFDRKWAELCDLAQRSEEEKIIAIKQCLKQATMCQLELYQLYAQAFDRMRQAVDIINPERDMNLFVQTSQTGHDRSPRFEFVSFYDAIAHGQNLTPASVRKPKLSIPIDGGYSESQIQRRMTLVRESSFSSSPSAHGLSNVGSHNDINAANVSAAQLTISSTSDNASPTQAERSPSYVKMGVRLPITALPPMPPMPAGLQNNEEAGIDENAVLSNSQSSRRTFSRSATPSARPTLPFGTSPTRTATVTALASPTFATPRGEEDSAVEPSTPQETKPQETRRPAPNLEEQQSRSSAPTSPLSLGNFSMEKPNLDLGLDIMNAINSFSVSPLSAMAKESSIPEPPPQAQATTAASQQIQQQGSPSQSPPVQAAISIDHLRRADSNTSVGPSLGGKTQSEEVLSGVLSANLPKRTYSRRTIKNEGWLDIAEENAKTWTRRWCAVEGGFLWFFETPQDNAKPQGLNKPKGMIGIGKASIESGNQASWTPEGEPKEHMITLNVDKGKRVVVIAPPNEEEMYYWVEAMFACRKRVHA